jgi:hypothetical protein
MDRKTIVTTAVCAVLTFFAVALVAAHPQIDSCGTPLYTFRMEQASSEMHFLPTEVNGFSYAAEKGYTVNYDGAGVCCDFDSSTPNTTVPNQINTMWITCTTCGPTCETCILTCDTCYCTCWETCKCTCQGITCDFVTCDYTCEDTCDTCFVTCFVTCWDTCNVNTCFNTCDPTCLQPTCEHTCYLTCEPTCHRTFWPNCPTWDITCHTCPITCSTCLTCNYTCWSTCIPPGN